MALSVAPSLRASPFVLYHLINWTVNAELRARAFSLDGPAAAPASW